MKHVRSLAFIKKKITHHIATALTLAMLMTVAAPLESIRADDAAGMAGMSGLSGLAGLSGMTDMTGTDGTGTDSESAMAMMAMLYSMSDQDPIDLAELDLPADTSQFSFTLAKQALTLCSGGNASGQAKLFRSSGLDVIMQKGYDKSSADTSDTSAFSVGRGTVSYGGTDRTLLVVAIRGTSGGEWYSNFDFSWDRNGAGIYSENFLFAAQVISLRLQPLLVKYPDALFLVCGHSRGAAVANLLGMTLDDMCGADRVFTYTYATPATCRDTERISAYHNIFNLINPADVVTNLPLAGWGYGRIGTDITLPNDPETITRVATAMNELYMISPTVDAYYNERHSLTSPGLIELNSAAASTVDVSAGAYNADIREKGMTTYEVMCAMASSLTRINTGLNMSELYSRFYSDPASASSDLAPLMLQLRKVIDTDGTYGMSVFGQHMPGTYLTLIQTIEQMYPNGMMSMTAPDMMSYDMIPEGMLQGTMSE